MRTSVSTSIHVQNDEVRSGEISMTDLETPARE
jgi:hypothetical protein